jgi:uncharacterized protein YjiS (DUF1127 family)
MNGLSDVRLALYSQELSEGIGAKLSCPPNLNRWALYRHRWMSRNTLLKLTTEQLHDIGITTEQARAEGLKPFWRD